MNYILGVSLLVLMLLNPFCAQGQMVDSDHQVYSVFDSIMGEQNMELYNGPIFRERLSTASTTHPFFLQSDFTELQNQFTESSLNK